MNVNGLFWEFEFYRLSYVLCFLSVGSGVTAGESLNSISVDLIAPSHYFFSHIHGWDIEFVVGLFFGGVLLRDSVFFCCLLFAGRRFGVFRSVFWGEFCYIVSRAVIICWLCWLDVWLVAIHEFVYCRAVTVPFPATGLCSRCVNVCAVALMFMQRSVSAAKSFINKIVFSVRRGVR